MFFLNSDGDVLRWMVKDRVFGPVLESEDWIHKGDFALSFLELRCSKLETDAYALDMGTKRTLTYVFLRSAPKGAKILELSLKKRN